VASRNQCVSWNINQKFRQAEAALMPLSAAIFHFKAAYLLRRNRVKTARRQP
jgi:hypothetical protein